MPSTPVFQAGALLAGKYRVDALLGQGGMGAVYLAENVDIGRAVAIKVLKPELAADPQALARFKQEARAAAAIGHPGIVEILDMGLLDEGGAYIVMERLEGETLRERLAKVGTLTPTEAVELVGAVLETLAAAHDKGVIHRDLKPDNLFLVEHPFRATKILDFGISKFRNSGDVGLTRTGTVMGTPLYMSPEQARGSRDVGTTTDLYSVGAILFETLSGQPPFPGESYNEVLAKVLMEPVRPLAQLRPDVPPALVELIESLLSKDPTKRPQSAREAAQRLRQSLFGANGPAVIPLVAAPARAAAPLSHAELLGATAPPSPRPPTAPSPAAMAPVAPADEPLPDFRPHPGRWVLLGLGVLVVGGGAYAFFGRTHTPSEPLPVVEPVQRPPEPKTVVPKQTEVTQAPPQPEARADAGAQEASNPKPSAPTAATEPPAPTESAREPLPQKPAPVKPARATVKMKMELPGHWKKGSAFRTTP